MQFQHSTPIPATTGLTGFAIATYLIEQTADSFIGSQQSITQDINSGSGFNFLTSTSPTFSFTLQQLFVSWDEVQVLGDIVFQGLLTIEEDTPTGNILIPCWNVAFGQNGLRVLNNATGGQYHVSLFYTQTGA